MNIELSIDWDESDIGPEHFDPIVARLIVAMKHDIHQALTDGITGGVEYKRLKHLEANVREMKMTRQNLQDEIKALRAERDYIKARP